MLEYIKFWITKQLVEIGIAAGIFLIVVVFFIIGGKISKGRKKKDENNRRDKAD